MSEWGEATLGDLMTLDVNAVEVDPAQAYDIVGVLNRGRGLLYREPMSGSKTAYKTLNRIGPNQVVYSRLKAFEGAITVTPADLHEVYASQEFPTFICGPSVLPDYFRLLTTTKRLWDTLQNLSTGMGGRRERVKPNDFLTIKIALPSLAEQRRIVDVMRVVDDHIETLTAELAGAERAALTMAEDALRSVKRVTLGQYLVRIDGGRSPMTTGEPPTPDQRGVLKVSAVTPFRFVPEESKALFPDTAMTAKAAVGPGDVLITRANTPDRVGAVCRVPQDVRTGLFLSDKTLRLVPREPDLDADFLVVAMGLTSSRQHLTGEASGSSASMFNISQSKIRATPVPLPLIAEQKAIAATVLSARSVVDGLVNELIRLRTYRSTLVTALVNQEIEIPESYDVLLEAVS